MQAAKKAAAKREAEEKPPTFVEKMAGYVHASKQFFAVLGYYLVGLVFYTQVEGWKPYEALYFTTVTVTTVGYGDFSPSTDEGKLFTIIFILVGLGAIGNILTGAIEALLDKAEEAAEKAAEKQRANDFNPDAPLPDESFCGNMSRFLTQHGRKLSLTIGLIVGVILLGTIFFGLSEGLYADWDTICAGNDPGDSLFFTFNKDSCICELKYDGPDGNTLVDCDSPMFNETCATQELSSTVSLPFCARPFLDGLYWTWVTTFTVGYGDWGLNMKRSYIFSTFFLVISTAVVCVAIGNFIEIATVEKKQAELKAVTQEILANCSTEAAFNKMLLEVDGPDGDGTIDKGEFLAYCLVKLNLVEKEECDHWLDHFKEIDEDGSGYLDSDDLAAMQEKEEKEKASGGATGQDAQRNDKRESFVATKLGKFEEAPFGGDGAGGDKKKRTSTVRFSEEAAVDGVNTSTTAI
jgi:Ca2+-binding EF-hand superfamily protein